MSEYHVGEMVTYTRMTYTLTTPIVAVVPKAKDLNDQTPLQPQYYILEAPLGWNPCSIRCVTWNLETNKTYIMVNQDELQPAD